MHVVAAGVGHRHLMAVSTLDGHGAGVVDAGVFPDRQRVEFGPEQDGGPAAVGQDAHHPGAADPGLDGEPVFVQLPGDLPGRAVLLVGQLGMLVQVLVKRLLTGLEAAVAGHNLGTDAHSFSPPEKICTKNRKTFRTSRKIEAARKGAELMSPERRSRWKSNMVKPAKITRPSTE